MKIPKNQKLEEEEDQNKKYNFFEEGLFPEKKEIKKIKNKSSHKENKRPPFTLPEDMKQKKPPNTQNDEDLLPFFAKDYPNSDSESNEEICFINSPIASQSSFNGKQSIDFNSELEAEQEKKSNMMSREEVVGRFKKQQEINK